MHDVAEIAEAAKVSERTVRRWTVAGVLVKHPAGYTDGELEIAKVIAQVPSGDNNHRRRLAGMLRRQLRQSDRWDGLVLAWPSAEPELAGMVNIADLDDLQGCGVLSVLPLPMVLVA